MLVKTRPAQSEDIEFLADLFLSSMRESITVARGFWDRAKEDEQFRRQLELEHTRVIQLRDADVGLVTVRREHETLLVSTLCVSTRYQGSGIGTQIMHQVMKDAELAGLRVELFVLKANARARALYTRLGFAEAEGLPNHVRMRWPRAG